MGRHLIAAGTEHYVHHPQHRLALVGHELDTIVSVFDSLGYANEVLRDPAASGLLTDVEDWLKHEARAPDDIAVIYYTGHGFSDGNDYYLAAADTRFDRVSTALEPARIMKLLGKDSPVRSVLVIIDACYAGHGLIEAIKTAAGRESDAGVWLMAASLPKQTALAGAFANALESSVRDLTATTGETQEYLSIELLTDMVSKRLNGRQALFGVPHGASGLSPFFPNLRFDPRAVPGEDLDARRSSTAMSHFAPKARGVEVAAQAGDFFCGRGSALSELSAWLAGPGRAGLPRVVTGQPGAGKSAVLGRLLLAEHAPRIDAAVLASRKPADEVLAEIAAQVGIHGGKLHVEISRDGKTRNVIIDGLDEADSPETLVQDVIVPLVERSQDSVRLVLGTRRSELPRLRFPYRLIDLDTPDYVAPGDIAAYVTALLLDPQSRSPYRGDEAAARAAAAVVEARAERSFLLARVAASWLRRGAQALTPEQVRVQARLWRTVGDAFDEDLRRYGDDRDRVRDLLRPLAWARGSGLPWENVWARLATGLSGQAYDDEDVRWLHENAGAYVVEANETGRALYRLVHQELVDHLRRDDDPVQVESTITDVLLELVPSGDWFAAHPYIRRHLAMHAAHAERIDELLGDAGFLVAADQARLTRAAWRTHTEAGAQNAAARLLADEHLRTAPPEQAAAALGLAARQRGATALAESADALFPRGPWRARWADWSGSDPHRTLTRMGAPITALGTFGWEDDVAVAAGETLRVLDFGSGAVLAELVLDSPVESLLRTRVDEAWVLVAGTTDGRVHAIDTRDWSVTSRLADGAGARVLAAEGEVLITAGHGENAGVQAWTVSSPDAAAWTPRWRFEGTVSSASLVKLRDTPALAIAGDGQWAIRLLDLDTGASCGALPTDGDGQAALFDGTLVVRHASGRLTRWDPATAKMLAETVVSGGGAPTPCPTMVNREPAIAILTATGIELRDAAVLEPLPGWRPMMVRGGSALVAAMQRNRVTLITGGHDGVARAWDPDWRYTTGGPPPEPRGAAAVAVTPTRVVAGGPDGLKVYDLDGGALREAVPGRAVTALAALGERVFAGGADGEIRCGEAPPIDAGSPVTALATCRHGRQMLVAAATEDLLVRVFDGDTGRTLALPRYTPPYAGARLDALGFADGRLVGARYGNEEIVWELDALLAGAVDGTPPPAGRPFARAVEVNGVAMLVTAGHPGVRVVRRDTLEPIAEIPLDGRVTGLAATPYGVVAGTEAGVVAINL